jgi:large subunit ribosomal protein L23
MPRHVPKTGLDLQPYQIILRPMVTEKTTRLTEDNAFVFQVHPQSNKTQIKAAVEELFNVKVLEVRTQNRLGKARRHKFRMGRTKPIKKAIIKLHEEDRLEFF